MYEYILHREQSVIFAWNSSVEKARKVSHAYFSYKQTKLSYVLRMERCQNSFFLHAVFSWLQWDLFLNVLKTFFLLLCNTKKGITELFIFIMCCYGLLQVKTGLFMTSQLFLCSVDPFWRHNSSVNSSWLQKSSWVLSISLITNTSVSEDQIRSFFNDSCWRHSMASVGLYWYRTAWLLLNHSDMDTYE